MAENRVPYIIELTVNDKDLRTRMSKLNWEEILGTSKGKSFKQVLKKDTEAAAQEIKNTLGGLGIDWGQILGAKDFELLEKKIAKIITANTEKLKVFGREGDTTGIQNTIDLVSALGNELKSLGSGFDAASLVRNANAFIKVLTPISAKIEQLAKEPEKVSAAFDRLFNGTSVGANNVAKSSEKIVNVMAKIETATKRTGGAQASLDKLVNKFNELKNAKLPDLSSFSLTQLEDEMDKLETKWDELEQRFAGKSKRSSDYQLARGKLLLEEKNIAEAYNNVFGASGLDNDAIGDIDKQLKQIESMFSSAIDKLQKELSSESFAQQISKQLSNININLSLDEKSRTNFINEINTFVRDVNKTPLERVKIEIGDALDDSTNVIEDKTKRAYKDNPADDDAATTELVNKTIARLDRVTKAIGDKQQAILDNTNEWRGKMLKAMQIGKDDLNFQFGWDGHLKDSADSLFNKLQAYFEQPEYALNLYFDTKNIAQNLRDELNAEGITINGGGSTTIDANGLASAFYSMLFGKTPSGFSVPTESQSGGIVPLDLDDELDETIDSGKEYVKVLDETTIHIDKVIESLRNFAKTATKPNASKGAKEVAKKLYDIGAKRNKETGEIERAGIDLASIADGATDTDIIKMLQDALMTKDKMGKPLGTSLAGELQGMISSLGMHSDKGAGKLVDILSKDIKELFNINDIETELVEEVEKRLNQLDLWKGVEKPGRALASLGMVRSTKDQIATGDVKIPSLEDFDKAIHFFEVAGENTDALKKFKQAREELGFDESEEAKQRFVQAATTFYDETKSAFNKLSKLFSIFRGVVYPEGLKPVTINPKGAYPYKMLDIPENAIISKVDVFKSNATFNEEDFSGNYNRRRGQERRLTSQSSGYDIATNKPNPKKDIKNETITYVAFKPQEVGTLPSGEKLDSTMSALKKQADELPEIINRINQGRATVTELEEAKKQLEADISRMQVEDLPQIKTGAFKVYSGRSNIINDITKNAQNALNTGTGLELGNTSQLDKEQSALAERLKLVIQNIHDDSVASQEFADKIAEITKTKRLGQKQLEQLRKAAGDLRYYQQEKQTQQRNIETYKNDPTLTTDERDILINNAQIIIDRDDKLIEKAQKKLNGRSTDQDLYRDLLFDSGAVDNRLLNLQTQKSDVDQRIKSNKKSVSTLIKRLEKQNATNVSQATQEAQNLATQLIELKERLYAEAEAYIKALNDPNMDEGTRNATLGKLQQTVNGLNRLEYNFAEIQSYIPDTSFYTPAQEKKVGKWNEKYTTQEVRILEKQLSDLEKQLSKETDEVKIKELNKKIGNVKGLITRRKKNDIVGGVQSNLSDVENRLIEETQKLNANETDKKAAERAAHSFEHMKKEAEFLAKYNKLLEKEQSLLEQIDKLKKKGANQSKIDEKSEKLKQTTKELNEFLAAEQNADRTAYAREKAVEYQAQLTIARRQRSAFDRQLENLDTEENSIKKYGMTGRVGANAIRKTKKYAIDDFMQSDYVKIQEKDLFDEAKAKSDFIIDEEAQKKIWEQYYKDIEALRERLRKDFESRFITDKGVLNTTFKTQDEAGNWVDDVKQYDVKNTVLSRISSSRAIAEENRKPLDDIIKDIETQQKAAMRYGVVGYEDLYNDQRLKEIDSYNKQIEDKQKELNKLEQEKAKLETDDSVDKKAIKKKQKEIDVLNQEIASLETQIQNRVELISRKHQEKEDSKLTPEEKVANATEKLTAQKERLAKIEETIAQRRKEYEDAKGTENEMKTLEALDEQIKKRDKLKEQIKTTKQNIARWKEKEVPLGEDDGLPQGGIIGQLLSSVGEGIELDTTDLAKDSTLQDILNILNNGVPTYSGGTRQADTTDYNNKKARIAELEAKEKTVVKTSEQTSAKFPKEMQESAKALYKTWNVKANELEFESVKQRAIELKKVIDTLYDEGKVDTQEFINTQTELSKLLSGWRNKIGKSTNKEVYSTDGSKEGLNNWKAYLTSGDAKFFDNLDNVELGSISQKDYISRSKKVYKDSHPVTPTESGTKNALTRAEKKELKQLRAEVKEYESSGITNTSHQRTTQPIETSISDESLQELVNLLLNSQSGDTSTPEPGGKSTGALVQYSKMIEQAQASKYLMTDDAKVTEFNNLKASINDILTSVANGTPLTDQLKQELTKLNTQAINAGESIKKTISQNQKLYVGSNEVNSAEKQYDRIVGTANLGGISFDKKSTGKPKVIQEYIDAYNALNDKYKEYVKQGEIHDPKKQEALRQQAAGVQALGKRLMTSVTQAEKLQQLVEQSGTYTNRRTGEVRNLGGHTKVTGADTSNLEPLMRNFVRNDLKQANIEGAKFDAVNQRLIYTFRTSKNTVADMVVQYNEAEQALYAYQKQERESLTGFPALMSGLKSKMKSIMQYTASITSIYRVLGELKQGVQYVKEIDAALTELKKVTDETEETYDRFLDTAAKTASKIGSTIKEVVSSTADFARLGYTIEEATEMATSAQVLMNVSEFTDISTATDSLISSIQAFKYTAEESMDVVDILNTIGNNYAISTADLATSLTKSSGSLVAANGTLEEAVALTATANTIIQDADVVGTALKTVAMRLRGTSTKEMEAEGIDTDGAVTSKSKLQSKIKGYSGVDILTDTGAYKSTYQILSEIAEVWEDINDMDQAALLELLAGKRAGSVMSAILQNPETLKDAFESASDASGSALKENEKYLDSIQGKIDLFNNAMQTMWSNTLDSEFIKGFVSLGTELIKIVDELGVINTLLIGFGVFATKKYNLFGDLFGSAKNEELIAAQEKLEKAKARLANAQAKEGTDNAVSVATMKRYESAVRSAEKEVNGLNEELKEKVIINKLDKQTTEQKTASTWKELGAQIMSGQVTKENIAAGIKNILVNKLMNTTLGEAIAKHFGIQVAELGTLTVTQLLTGGFTALGTAIWTALAPFLPFIAAAAALAGAVALVTWGIDETVTTATEAKEELAELNTEIDSLSSELNDLNDKLETTQARMEELLSKDSLSFVEQEELNNLKLQNEYLEKQIELQKLLIQNKKDARVSKAKGVIAKTWDSKSYGKEDYQLDWDTGAIKKDDFWSIGLSGKDAINKGIESYLSTKHMNDLYRQGYINNLNEYGAEDDRTIAAKDLYDTNQKTLDSQVSGIYMVLDDMSNIIAENELQYGDDAEVNKFLDEYYAMSLKWQEAQGLAGKSDVIKHIFNDTSSESVQNLKKQLNEIASSELDNATKQTQAQKLIQDALNNTDKGYQRLKTTVDTLDMSADELAKSFIAASEAPDISTLGGVLQVFADGEDILKQSSKYKEQIKNEMTELQSGGSVDLLNRKQINTADMMKAFYSQDKYAEELAKELEGVTEQDLSTVWTHSFSNKDFGLSGPEVAMNFTPILPDGTVMEKDAFESYVESVLSGAEDTQHLKIGVTFEGENAIEEAAKTAQRIHILQQDYFNQVQLGTDENGESITWDNLFIQEGDKKVADNLKVAAILEGSDEKIREQFTNLVEEVENGKMSVDEALAKWKMVGVDKAIDTLNTEFESLNNEMFPDAADEISGLIDTLSELKTAFEAVANTMDTFKSAQEEYNENGRISIQTALELMSSTDDWDKVLNITEDSITLVDGAEKALMESQLKSIAEQMQYAADLAKAKLDAAEQAQAAKQAFDAETQAVNNLNTAEQGVTATQQNANVVTGQRTGAMGSLAEQTYVTAGSELDYAANDGVVQTAESTKAKAIGLVSAAIVGLDAFIEALLTDKTMKDAWNDYQNARDLVIADANSKTTTVDTLRKDYEKKQAMANVAKNGDTYNEFNSNWDGSDDEKDKASDAFQKEMDYWENRIAANQARYEQIQNEIDLIEKQGGIAGKEYYEEQIRLENERLKLLESQKAAAQKYLGTFKEGSSEWWEVASQLNDIEGEIDDVTSSVQDLQDAISDIDWKVFDETHERFGTLIDDLETIRDLIAPNGEEDWFDDEGQWSEDGVAVLGSYVQQLEMYKNGLEEVNKKLEEYNRPYAGNEVYYKELGIDSEQEYYDAYRKLQEQQQEYLKGISDTEQAVVDMYEAQVDAIEEYTNKLVESYQDYIDVVKEALDAERDLYDFKKNVEKQTKDIAALERRIASLSGSTDDSDIAERRKLEAELYEAREGLNDTYYEHSMNAQQEALDNEMKAYEESMTHYIETLRQTLEDATLNMDLFMDAVTSSVMLNADTVAGKYDETGVAMSGYLTQPWLDAADAVKDFEGDSLAQMNTWTTEEGYFGQFKINATEQLKSPWTAGTNAANSFKTDVSKAMDDVVKNVQSNVAKAQSSLSSLHSQIQDTSKQVSNVGNSANNVSGNIGDNNNNKTPSGESVKALQEVLNTIFNAGLTIDGKYGAETKSAVKTAQKAMKNAGLYSDSIDGFYGPKTASGLSKYIQAELNKYKAGPPSQYALAHIDSYSRALKKVPPAMYAKGTLGTKQNEWAITDESWIGEEITLAAGKHGQLQYLKKGSAVMPADISANLVEWGKLDPSSLTMPGVGNVLNIIGNSVIQPNYSFSFGSLVHVDHCDEGTLKNLEKMVDSKLNDFGKQLNYSVKKYAR